MSPTNTEQKEELRSNAIDFFRVIGIVMIIVYHCYMTVTSRSNRFYSSLPEGIDIASLNDGIEKNVLLVTSFFGTFGNLIFIISSAWFLYFLILRLLFQITIFMSAFFQFPILIIGLLPVI